MSVQTTLNRTDYTPSGSATAFAYSFNVYTQSDLLVYRTPQNGVATLSVLNGAGTYDYIQSAVNTPGSSVAGGTVTFNTAPLSTDKITLLRVVSLKQATSLSNFDKFDAKSTLEEQFDLTVMMVQQNNETLNRAMQWPVNANLASPTLPDPTIAANQGGFLYIKADGSSILAGTPIASGSIILPLTVANGGTASGTALNNNRVIISSSSKIVEQTALTAKSFIYADASGLPVTTAAPTNGQLLIGSTGAVPVAAALTAGSGISVTNGAGTITIAASAVTGTLTAGTPCVMNPRARSTATAQAHGLGAIPTFVTHYAECLSTEAGYAVGDRVSLNGQYNAANVGSCVQWNSTTVTIVTGSDVMDVFNLSTGAAAALSDAKWKVVAVPYLKT